MSATRLGVDVGGTFTGAARVHGGRLHTAKVPTTPGREHEGVIASVEQALQRAGAAVVRTASRGATP